MIIFFPDLNSEAVPISNNDEQERKKREKGRTCPAPPDQTVTTFSQHSHNICCDNARSNGHNNLSTAVETKFK